MGTVTIHDLEKYAAEDEQKKKINNNRTLLARANALNLEAEIHNWHREAFLKEQLILELGSKSSYPNHPIQNIIPVVVIEKAKERENGIFKFTNEDFDEFVKSVLNNITHLGARNAWQQTLTAIGPQGFQKSLNRATQIMAQGPIQFNVVLNSSSSASPISSTAPQGSVLDNKKTLLPSTGSTESSDGVDSTHSTDSIDISSDSETVLDEKEELTGEDDALTKTSEQSVQVIDLEFNISDNLDFHFYKGLKNLINQTINGNGFAAVGLLVMYDQRSEMLTNFTRFAGKENIKQADYYRSTTEFVSSCGGAMVKRFSQADVKSIYRNLSQCSLIIKDTSQRQTPNIRKYISRSFQ